MPEQIWILQRGPHDPAVWPFHTQQQAEDFAADHALIDYRATRQDDHEREHEAVCARDLEPWPCRHVRIERKARNIIHAEANRCHRCGKQIGWLKVTFKGAGEFGQDISYHGKLGACFNEARRRAEESQDAGALRDIRGCDESREYTHRARARVAPASRYE